MTRSGRRPAGRRPLRGHSAADYRAIFDAATDAIFIHDLATGAIVDVNHKVTEMYGVSREDALRLTIADLSAGLPPDTQARALERLHLASAGTPQTFEWLAKDLAGRTFWVEVTLKRAAIGGRDCLLAFVRDIEERKRAQREIETAHESQKILNALLQLALEDLQLDDLLQRALSLVLHGDWPSTRHQGAVFLLDETTGEVVLQAHIGLDPELVGRCARVPVGRCLCGRVAQSGTPIHAAGVTEAHDIVYDGIAAHGHYCTPIPAGGKVLGVLNVYLEPGHQRDAAEEEFFSAFASTLASIIVRKRAEASLRTADEQLREQAALVRLGEMAAVVAHEVKNPLAGIRGAIQIVRGHLPPDSRDVAIVGDVIARLDALNELMTDMLLFARPPQLSPAPLDVVALARETAALVSQDPEARGIRFEVHGSAPPILADPRLLRIVLLNLLVNAAHALGRDGTIRTSVTAGLDTCRIAVADTGPGIPAEIRERVFVPFFTTKPRGTGLGLSTAKRLIDAHQGRVTLQCPVAGGTIITIELPRRPPTTSMMAPVKGARAGYAP